MLDPLNISNVGLWWSESFLVASTISWYVRLAVALGIAGWFISYLRNLVNWLLGFGQGVVLGMAASEFRGRLTPGSSSSPVTEGQQRVKDAMSRGDDWRLWAGDF